MLIEKVLFREASGLSPFRPVLYDKIAEQSVVIRNAREKLRQLLDDDEGEAEGEDTTD